MAEVYLTDMIYNFRYFGLFFLLTFGVVGIPMPVIIILTFSGFQVSLGRMDFTLTVLAAASGCLLGMNLGYWIGRRVGIPVLKKIGPVIHLTDQRLSWAEQWFNRFGDYILLIGYYIPGFRHFPSYFSGISRIHYGRFVLLAGAGAFIWVLIFISLGRALGEHWNKANFLTNYNLIWLCFALVVAAFGVFLYKRKKI